MVSQLDKEFKEMPAASMPSTSFASSNNNKTSYSSQLLMALGSSNINSNSNSKSNSNLVSVLMLFFSFYFIYLILKLQFKLFSSQIALNRHSLVHLQNQKVHPSEMEVEKKRILMKVQNQ